MEGIRRLLVLLFPGRVKPMSNMFSYTKNLGGQLDLLLGAWSNQGKKLNLSVRFPFPFGEAKQALPWLVLEVTQGAASSHGSGCDGALVSVPASTAETRLLGPR